MTTVRPGGIFIEGTTLLPSRPRRPPSRIRDDGGPLPGVLTELNRVVEQRGAQVRARVIFRDWSNTRVTMPAVIEALQRESVAMQHVPSFDGASRARKAWTVGKSSADAPESTVSAMFARAEAWAENDSVVLMVLDERRMLMNAYRLMRLRERAEVIVAAVEHVADGTLLRVGEGSTTKWPARVWEPQS